MKKLFVLVVMSVLFLASSPVCANVQHKGVEIADTIYNVTATVLLKDNENSGTASSFADLGMQSQVFKVEDEMEVLSSMPVIRAAVIDAHLNVKYTSQGKSLKRETTPLLVSLDEESASRLSSVMTLSFNVSENDIVHVSYICNENAGEDLQITEFPYVLKTNEGDVVIERNETVALPAELSVSVIPVGEVAGIYKEDLTVAPLSDNAFAALLSINTSVPSEAIDFLNSMIASYNKINNSRKLEENRITLAFIEKRLEELRLELEALEESAKRVKGNDEYFSRELAIKKDLYLMLLRKYKETSLSIESTPDDLSCIDAPAVVGIVSVPTPIAPIQESAEVDKTTMEKLIGFCLDNLNYGTVMLFMAIESSFIPFPSEAVVPPAAWKAATTGDMNIVLVVVFATLGALIGALINYYVAVWLGRPIIYKFANSRVGHMCLIDEMKVQKAETYFAKHGVVSTFIGRLVPVVRQLISLPAGLARMGIGRFIIYTSLGAAIWNIILATLGYYMSTIPGMQTEAAVMEQVKEYSGIIGWVFIALAIFVVGVLLYKGLKKDKK